MKKLSLLLLPLLLLACHPSKPKMNEGPNSTSTDSPILFDLFIGTWQNKTFGNFEKWEKVNTNEYGALSFTVNGRDTVVQETVKVSKEAGKWVYEVTVKNQNGGQPVKFTASSFTANQVNFSNPGHDFPTDINYSFAGQVMQAFISGIGRDGTRDTISFAFARVDGK